MKNSFSSRIGISLAAALILLFVLASLPPWLIAAADANTVKIDASAAQPRQVEDATVQAIQRDYGRAWQTLSQALSENRANLLNSSFVGIANDKLTRAVNEQRKEGLRRKYIDKSHKVEIVFYSAEGSALQLRDTVQIEIQLLDGDKVVHTENATRHYIALMTPTENSWKVRVFEAVPGA